MVRVPCSLVFNSDSLDPQIPLYAIWKVWSSVIYPYFIGSRPSASAEESEDAPSTSKRQEKLRKRSEKGDPRVKTQSVRR